MKLIEFIKSNKDWEEKLREKRIKIKKNGNLAIFNYEIGADFHDSLVRECRGVILDDELNVVCRGFDKFGNYSESYAAEIDWNSAVVQEKIDGSIIKLYWYGDKWNYATNGMIYAEDAPLSQECMYKNFRELIDSADNLPKTDNLDRDFTYIFELVSPFNQIVIRYPFTHLYHIGTRNNRTGQEINADIGIEKPKKYDLHSLEMCVNAVKTLNDGEDVLNEGFVVCDKDYNRVKIKTPEYFELHRISTSKMTKEKAIILLRNSSYEKLIEAYPQYDVELAWYLYQWKKYLRNVQYMETYALNLYKEYEGDRKLVALAIKDDPYCKFGFAALDGKPFDAENTEYGKIKNFISDFGGENE